MTQVRKRVHHTVSLDDRLAEAAREARRQAQTLPNGQLRDALLGKARQYEAQISTNAWLMILPAQDTERNR